MGVHYMLNNIRTIAIVGLGGMGSGHAEAISKISEKLILAGTFDIDPARQQYGRDMGYHIYDSFEAVLSDTNVDIVLIATPNHLHKKLCIAAMRAGKHVLCEKPVTPTSAELEEIMKVSKETGKVFYPRQNRRWDKDFLTIKYIYDNKILGDVFNVESRVQGSRGIPGDWRGKKEFGGGMMLDWGVHLIDRLLIMIPEKVKYVFCSLTNITNDEVDDGFKMMMTFESGITAVVEVGTCHFISLPLWFMAGNKGTVSIKDWRGEGKINRLRSWDDKDAKPIEAAAGLTKTMAPRINDSVEELPLPDVDYDPNALYYNLVDTVDQTAEQIVKPEQALRVLRIMEAAFRSAAEHSVVEFEK